MKKSLLLLLIIIIVLGLITSIVVSTYAIWQKQEEATQTVEIAGPEWNSSLPFIVFIFYDDNQKVITDTQQLDNANYAEAIGYKGTIGTVEFPEFVTLKTSLGVSTEKTVPLKALKSMPTASINNALMVMNVTLVNSNISFTGNQFIKQIKVSSNIVEIGDACFLGCTNLISVQLKYNTSTLVLHEYAFSDCINFSVFNRNDRIYTHVSTTFRNTQINP